jgi:hypothetical protein
VLASKAESSYRDRSTDYGSSTGVKSVDHGVYWCPSSSRSHRYDSLRVSRQSALISSIFAGFLTYRCYRAFRPPSARPGVSTLEFRLVMSDVERCLAEVYCAKDAPASGVVSKHNSSKGLTPASLAPNASTVSRPVTTQEDQLQPQHYSIDPIHNPVALHNISHNREFFNLMLPTISEGDENATTPAPDSNPDALPCLSIPAANRSGENPSNMQSPSTADYHINYENISIDEYDLPTLMESTSSIAVHTNQNGKAGRTGHTTLPAARGRSSCSSASEGGHFPVACSLNPLIARGKMCYHLTRLRIALDRLFLTNYWANSDNDPNSNNSNKQTNNAGMFSSLFGVFKVTFQTVFGSVPSLEIHSNSEFVSVTKDVALLASPDFEVSAQRKLQTAARMRLSYQCLVAPMR